MEGSASFEFGIYVPNKLHGSTFKKTTGNMNLNV